MKFGGMTSISRVLLPVFLFVGTSVYFVDAFRRPIFEYGVPSAGFLPVLLSLIMFASLGILACQTLFGRGRSVDDVQPDTQDVKGPAVTAISTLVYIGLFNWIGYAISTLLYVYVLLLIFGFAKGNQLAAHTKRIAASILITAAMYFFFSGVFQVRLPTLKGII